jgi:hypothetical protein
MLRRALSRLVLALLPVALLLPLPAIAGIARVPTIERSVDADAVVANGTHQHQKQVASSSTQWTDEEDDPKRIARASEILTWAPITSSHRPARPSDVLPSTQPTCARLPRGPPSS